MGTRAQAFTAKIRNLQEIQMRLVQGSVPLPQGHEIANSLKYFSATLVSFIKMRQTLLNDLKSFLLFQLNVLKDVPGQPMVKMRKFLSFLHSTMVTDIMYFFFQDVGKGTLKDWPFFRVWITKDSTLPCFNFLTS